VTTNCTSHQLLHAFSTQFVYTTSLVTRREFRNFSDTAQTKKWSIPETYAQIKNIIAALHSIPDADDHVHTLTSALRNPELRRQIASSQPSDLEEEFSLVTNFVTARKALHFGHSSDTPTRTDHTAQPDHPREPYAQEPRPPLLPPPHPPTDPPPPPPYCPDAPVVPAPAFFHAMQATPSMAPWPMIAPAPHPATR
jgi:hypothetical protein